MTTSLNRTIFFTIAAVTGSLLYFYFDPSRQHFFPPCPFFLLTGLSCPGCGSQRAFHDLLHGNILGAMDHNILFVIAIPLIAYSAIVTAINLASKKQIVQRVFYSPLFAKITLAAVLAFWMLRNIPIFPFTWLAP